MTTTMTDSKQGLVIRRLVGAGARAEASEWALRNATRKVVAVDSLPVDGDRIWLDDAPGSRCVADIWCFWAIYKQFDVHMVLTGRAIDGGHPTIGGTASARRSGRVLSTACDVRLGQVPRTEDAPLAALAHLERTTDDKPRHWMELRRLLMVGRANEVEGLAAQLVDTNPRQVFYVLATTYRALGRQAEALTYARIAAESDDERLAADARFLQSWLLVEAGAEIELEQPASAPALFTYHSLTATLNELEPGNPIEEARRAGVGAMARRGNLHFATSLAFPGPTYAPLELLYNSAGHELSRSRRVLHTLDDGATKAEVREHLHELDGLREMDVIAFNLIRGRVAARLDERALTKYLAAEVVRSLGTRENSIPLVLPRVDERSPTWTTATWLRAFWGSKPHRPLLEERLQMLPSTELVADDYLLREPVGQGASGTVWRAEHVPTGQTVAIKVITADDEASRTAFQHELEVAASLDHPRIASVWDWLQVHPVTATQSRGALQAGQLMVVTEFLAGGTLADKRGELSWVRCRELLFSLLDALAYLHSHGLVHRDVKPANVLVDVDGSLRLTDFGLASARDRRIAGTPAYMAPEQFESPRVDPTADLYALGCSAYDLVCGLPPFLGDVKSLRTAHRTAPRPSMDALIPVPHGLESWVHKCMAHNPRDRFSSAAEAAEALLEVGEPMQTETRRVPAPQNQVAETYSFDVGPPPPSRNSGPEAQTVRVIEVFQRRASWRQGLPTARRLEAGDPVPSWQADAATALWETWKSVATERAPLRVALTGESGRRLLVRQLLRRARIAGVNVHDVPVRGQLSIVWGEVRPEPDDPWLVLVDAADRAVDRTIELRRLGLVHCQWIVESRSAFTPRFAALAAMEGLGDPGRALACVARWCQSPGTRLVDGLLDVRSPRRTPEWNEQNARPGLIDAVLAVQRTGRSRRMLERVVGEPLTNNSLRDRAYRVNGAWLMPPGLRQTLGERLPSDLLARAHLRLAEFADDLLSREHHRLRSLTDVGKIEARASMWVTDHPHLLVDAPTLAELQRRLPPLLVRDPHLLYVMQLLTHRDSPAHNVPDTALARAWALNLEVRERGVSADKTVAILAAVGDESLPVAVRAHLAMDAATLAPNLFDAIVSVAPSLQESDYLKLMLSHVKGEFISGATFTDPSFERVVNTNCAHHAIERNDPAAALALTERGLGQASLVCASNRVVALLHADRLSEAVEEAATLAPLAAKGQRAFAGGAAAVVLLDTIDEPTGIWEAIVANSAPVEDLHYQRALRPHVGRRAPSPRRAALKRLLGNG